MIATTGFFDGVHLGHRLVIERLVSEAHARGDESLVVTFWPHPRAVLQDGARELRLLTSLEEKKALLLGLGVDRVEVVDFTRRFASLTAAEYLRDVLQARFGVTTLLMGYDNRIGSDRLTAGDLQETAQRLGLELVGAEVWFGGTDVPEPVATLGRIRGRGPRLAAGGTEQSSIVEGSGTSVPPNPISSTRIRKALSEGDIDSATSMLGYPYALKGVVVAGNRLGRTLGFPTANMRLYEPLKLVPANGVYAVEVDVLGSRFRGMTNIGVRPTVGGTFRTVETHILDFNEDIYGLPLRISFLRRIRDEIRFPSLEALKDQLEKDREACGFPK